MDREFAGAVPFKVSSLSENRSRYAPREAETLPRFFDWGDLIGSQFDPMGRFQGNEPDFAEVG